MPLDDKIPLVALFVVPYLLYVLVLVAVFALAFKNKVVIGFSYNGTPEKFNNCCEELKQITPDINCSKCKGTGKIHIDECKEGRGISGCDESYPTCRLCPVSKTINCPDCQGNYLTETSHFTLHAEENLVANCAKKGISLNQSVILTSLSPCIKCARLLLKSGIKRLYFVENFKSDDGINLLREFGIKCIKID
jgi:deoxycytidylate deaminase